MKTKLNFSQNSFWSGLKLYKNIYEAGAVVDPSNLKHLKLVFKHIGWRITFITLFSTRGTNRIRLLHNFCVHINRLTRLHGPTFVVKYLKACQLAVQKKLAGRPFHSLREIEPELPLPRLSRSGLPIFIKHEDRLSVSNGSIRIIRFWLSVLSCYRVLKAPVKSKLNTITDPFVGDEAVVNDFKKFLSLHSEKLLTNFNIYGFHPARLRADRLKFILKASPSSKVSWVGIFADLIALKNSNIWPSFREYIRLTGSFGIKRAIYFIEYILSLMNPGYQTKGMEAHTKYVQPLKLPYHDDQYLKDDCPSWTSDSGNEISTLLGQLSFKEEAAGKLRVFAMVDMFTQSLLAPLHNVLFRTFRGMPNDATFNQAASFKRVIRKTIENGCSYGFDLSSATDRLPISVQSHLLNVLTHSNLGDLWSDILVKRPYYVLSNNYGIANGPKYYSVGQPMGALSSWAMLNLTHHMMLQYCAWRHANRPYKPVWNTQYEVLGDDIAIFDRDLAAYYLRLCTGLGVTINTSKSIISDLPVAEFAKRTAYHGLDVSPLSFKEFISNNNFFGRLQLATRLVENNYGKRLLTLFKLVNMTGTRKFETDLPVVAYLAKLVRDKVVPMDSLMSYLYDISKPLTYFGRTIVSCDRSGLLGYLRSVWHEHMGDRGIKAPQLDNKLFYSVKQLPLKTAIWLNILKARKKFLDDKWIESTLYGILPYLGLENSYKLPDGSIVDQRDKYGESNLVKIQQAIVQLVWFTVNKNVNFRRQPFEWMQDNYLSYTIDVLKDQEQEALSILMEYEFFKKPVIRKQEIDNPLKILEFIRNSNSKEVSNFLKKRPFVKAKAASNVNWLELANQGGKDFTLNPKNPWLG